MEQSELCVLLSGRVRYNTDFLETTTVNQFMERQGASGIIQIFLIHRSWRCREAMSGETERQGQGADGRATGDGGASERRTHPATRVPSRRRIRLRDHDGQTEGER